MNDMRCKVVGNSIDEVYEAIIALKSRHGSNNVIVDQKDLYGSLHRETFINQNGVVEHKVKWSVYISLLNNETEQRR
jgi:hypothetical protein